MGLDNTKRMFAVTPGKMCNFFSVGKWSECRKTPCPTVKVKSSYCKLQHEARRQYSFEP